MPVLKHLPHSKSASVTSILGIFQGRNTSNNICNTGLHIVYRDREEGLKFQGHEGKTILNQMKSS